MSGSGGDLSELAELDQDEGFWDTLVRYGPVLEEAIKDGLLTSAHKQKAQPSG